MPAIGNSFSAAATEAWNLTAKMATVLTFDGSVDGFQKECWWTGFL